MSRDSDDDLPVAVRTHTAMPSSEQVAHARAAAAAAAADDDDDSTTAAPHAHTDDDVDAHVVKKTHTHTASASAVSASHASEASARRASSSDDEEASVERARVKQHALTAPVLPGFAGGLLAGASVPRRWGTTSWTEIASWAEMARAGGVQAAASKSASCQWAPSAALNDKVALWEHGDSTRLEVDAIVNAANSSLLGGGGIDGAIHSAAGRGLYAECVKLNGCSTGQTKITGGHNLPCKHILHTVGPVGFNEGMLRSCYQTCLDVARANKCRTVAFCCVSTGIYGYPNEPASWTALETVRKELERHPDDFDRIIFVLFMGIDITCYRRAMPVVFPPA